MSDTFNPLSTWASGLLSTNDSKNVPQELRQKIALAMLMQKRPFPKTFGEGLSAIGDAIASRNITSQIEGEAAAAERAAQAARTSYDAGGGVASQQPSSPSPVAAAAISAPSALYQHEQPQTSQEPVAPTVQEGGPPSTRPMFRPSQPVRSAGNMQPPPVTPQLQESDVSTDAPIRTNQDGSIAGNITAPQALPPPTGAQSGRPTVADYGQKPILAPTPPPGAPVMAQGGEDPRRAIALEMMKRGQMGQPQRSDFAPAQPAPAAAAPATRGAPLPPPPAPSPDQGIRPAPPATPPIARMPPQQATQAIPPPGYVTPPQAEPTPPQVQTDNMRRLQSMIESAPPAERKSVAEALAPRMAIEQAKLAQEQKVYQDKLTQAHELRMERERQSATAANRVDEHAIQVEAATKAANENKLRAQFANLPPEDVIKNVNESKKIAKSGADALTASSAAMEAFKKGAITGFGADRRLDVAKLFTEMGLVDKGDRIANTETFRSAMQPVVAAILHQTSGTSQLSEGELAFAKSAAAGNINLDPQSIERLMTIIDKRSREVIKDHQTLTGALFGDEPRAKALYGVEMPKTKDDEARDWANDPKNANDPRAAAIRQRLGR